MRHEGYISLRTREGGSQQPLPLPTPARRIRKGGVPTPRLPTHGGLPRKKGQYVCSSDQSRISAKAPARAGYQQPGSRTY